MRAIEACRTPLLGAQAVQCDRCGLIELRYHSCRNRHCPKCQRLAKEHWLEARCAELLPVNYFHVVFTLPHALNPLAQGNPRVIYSALFQAASETLLTFGRNPRWLGGELGVTLVLHTWGQNLGQHLHGDSRRHRRRAVARRQPLYPGQEGLSVSGAGTLEGVPR
jgi:hypothetical protein